MIKLEEAQKALERSEAARAMLQQERDEAMLKYFEMREQMSQLRLEISKRDNANMKLFQKMAAESQRAADALKKLDAVTQEIGQLRSLLSTASPTPGDQETSKPSNPLA